MLDKRTLKALNRSDTRSLNLYNKKVGINGAITLADELPHTKIKYLNLSSNSIGEDGIIALANKLSNTKITHLNLTNNNIGDEGVSALAGALQSGSNLIYLNLMSNNIGKDGISALAEAIPNSKLQALNIESNNIGDSGALVLVKKLKNYHDLEYLNVRYNDINRIEFFENTLRDSKFLSFVSDVQTAKINQYTERNKKILDSARKVVKILKDSTHSYSDIKKLQQGELNSFEEYYKSSHINKVWYENKELMQQPNKEFICTKIQQAINYYYPQITNIVKSEYMKRDIHDHVSLADLESSGLLGEIFQYCNVSDVHY